MLISSNSFSVEVLLTYIIATELTKMLTFTVIEKNKIYFVYLCKLIMKLMTAILIELKA